MPTVLNIKPEEVDSTEKRSKFLVSVVGCGQKGMLFAVAFANAGFKVTCFDPDASVIKKLVKGKTPFLQTADGNLKSLITHGQLIASNELKKSVSKSDIIIVTVPPIVNDKKKIDYSEALNACKQVGSALHAGSLVIYGDIVGFGFTESVAKETLENTSGLKAGIDFGLAYVPIYYSIVNCELNVAGVGKASLDATTNIIKTINGNVRQVSSVKTAELATLFWVAKQDADTALANELAIFCEKANTDYFEVLRLLDLESKSLWPTTVEEKNKEYVYLLLESADSINAKLRIPALSRQINEDMVKHAINLTQDALRSCAKTLRRSRVAVLGTSSPNNVTGIFVKMLELKGAKVNLFDPVSKRESLEATVAKSSLNEAVEGTDCIIIFTRKDQLTNLNLKKLKPLTRAPSVIVDLAGVYEPQKAEAEGFLYRGLGRGSR